jgi:hypothetical protein
MPKFSLKSFFPDILHIRYTDKVMSKLPESMKKEWQEFLDVIPILEKNGIHTSIVPLSFDHKRNVWWADYPGSYTREHHPEWSGKPLLIVTIRVDDQGYCLDLTKNDIKIDHEKITYNTKKKFYEIMGRYKWMSWDGKQKSNMYILLE